MIRPFPQKQIAEALKHVKAITVGDRADSVGGHGGNMVNEIKAALFTYGNTTTKVISRIYGLGGKDFYAEDGHHFFQLAMDAVVADRVEIPLITMATIRGAGECAEAPLEADGLR